jgi:hypothetical protein
MNPSCRKHLPSCDENKRRTENDVQATAQTPFAGHRLPDKPLDRTRASSDPDFSFCLCQTGFSPATLLTAAALNQLAE